MAVWKAIGKCKSQTHDHKEIRSQFFNFILHRAQSKSRQDSHPRSSTTKGLQNLFDFWSVHAPSFRSSSLSLHSFRSSGMRVLQDLSLMIESAARSKPDSQQISPLVLLALCRNRFVILSCISKDNSVSHRFSRGSSVVSMDETEFNSDLRQLVCFSIRLDFVTGKFFGWVI